MKKYFYVLLALLIFVMSFNSFIVYSQENVEVDPKGEFTQIDVKKSNDAIKMLQSNNVIKRKKIIAEILNNPNDYNPPVLYVLSNVLFIDGEKDKGSFWFYIGQLRARIDANICADISARGAVSILNQEFGKIINEYTVPKIDLLEEIVPKVIDFVRNNNENYDRRWINLHGMGAILSSLGDENNKEYNLSLPKEEWTSIKEKTINDYYEGFKEAVASLKEENNK